MAYLQAAEESAPERVYGGLMRLFELRGCKVVEPAKPSLEWFLHEYGRGHVQIGTTAESGARLLVIVLGSTKLDHVEPLFSQMDSKLRSEPTARGYIIETLIVHNTAKYTKHAMFEKYGVIEVTKTFSQIICNPITSICASPSVRIVPRDVLKRNLLNPKHVRPLPSTDPVAFWLGARPGDVVEELKYNENTLVAIDFWLVGG